MSREDVTRARRRGLLEVARIENETKEILRVTNGRRRRFDITADPAERRSLVGLDTPPSAELAGWLDEVRRGLELADNLPPPSLSEDDLETMRALGYID